MKCLSQFSKQVLLLSLMLVVVATGCATREYVDQKVGELDVKSSEAIAQVRALAMQNQADIQSLSGRVSTLEQDVSSLKAREISGPISTSVIMSEDVFFEFGRFRLTDEAKAKLDSLIAALSGTNYTVIHLAGHTDSRGGEVLNFNLGQRRAQAVGAYLAQNGVDRYRIVDVSMGKQVPIASNQDRAGRAQNRRVEIRVLQMNFTAGMM